MKLNKAVKERVLLPETYIGVREFHKTKDFSDPASVQKTELYQ